MKRRTEITIETERVVVVAAREGRPRAGRDEGWCEECGAVARLIAVEDAAALLSVTPQAVVRWAVDARLHVARRGGAVRHICLSSLGQSGTRAAPKTWPPPSLN